MEFKKPSHQRWPYVVTALVLFASLVSYSFKAHESRPSMPKAASVVENAPVAILKVAPHTRESIKADSYGWLVNSDIARAVYSTKGLNFTQAQLDYMQSRYNVFEDHLK